MDVALESPQIPSYFSNIVTNLHSAFGIPVRGESTLEQRRLGLVQFHCLSHEDQPVDTDSHGVDVARVHGVANSAWFDHEDTLDDEDFLPHRSVYLDELSEYCLPPSECAGTPENVPAGTHLFVVVNYDADFPVESVTSLSYLIVIFSSIHHFVDYKHYRPTRGTRVSYN